MLRALVAYADREGLGDLDFETRKVDYDLRLDLNGGFLGLVPIATSEGRRTSLVRLPIGPPAKNNPGYPNFVVDNARYVLGIPKPNEKDGNAKKCFDSFKALIDMAAASSGDDGLRALAAFLGRPEELRRADDMLATSEAAKSTRAETSEKSREARGDRVLVPVLDSDVARRIHERSAVVKWWTARRASERNDAAAGPLGRCLVTGEMAPIVPTHPKLEGSPFPGTGAKLVALDKGAFTSQGLAQGDNAPVSESAARKYTAALNALLTRDAATSRRKSAIDLDESVVVFWTRKESDAPGFLLDVFAPPSRGDEARRAADAVWSGRASKSFDATPFYAVTLGVNSARVVVRDWFETTAAGVKEALDTWFADLHLGNGDPEPMPLGRLLRALEATPGARHDKRGLAPGLAATLFRAAVRGGPLPRSLLAAAVRRMRVPPRENDGPFPLRARVAIIKAVLLRMRRENAAVVRRRLATLSTGLHSLKHQEVSVALDESNVQPAYLLGRLFAALEKQQLDAAGRGHEPNATVRDRYYGAASSTPSAVFGRLLALSMHHASKARKEGRGIAAEKAKEQVMSRLPAAGFPRTLGLEDQGLFAVGYYHQRDAFFFKKSEDPKGETP